MALKILLITPPARTPQPEILVVPPLGLAYLAAHAGQHGFAVDILDAFGEGLDWPEFTARIAANSYDIIGLTGMTPVIDTVKRAAAICRAHTRLLILGGPHATAFRHQVFTDLPELDFACIGEGEESFLEFLSRVQANLSLEGIPGIMGRSGSSPPRGLIRNLDALAFPARARLPHSRYRYPLIGGRRITSMITSRGCPYACLFCDKGVFGSQWRARSAANVLREIDEVVKNQGIDGLIFYDDLFTLDRRRLREICLGLIERDYNLVWKAEGRVDIVDDELLALMKRAGCETIAYGVESANQNGLDFLRKKTTPAMAVTAFRRTRKAGIKTMGYFILGIPVETYEEAQHTIQFAIDLKADYAQFSILSPMPGAELYQQAVANGWYREIDAHNFMDKDHKRPVVISPLWSEEKLIAVIREAHRRFFFRPEYLVKNLRAGLRSGRIPFLVSQGLAMLRYLCR